MTRWLALLAVCAAVPALAQPDPTPDTPPATDPPPAATPEAPTRPEAPAADTADAATDPTTDTEDDGWGEDDGETDGWGDDGGFEGMGDLGDVKVAPPPPPRRGSITGFLRHELGVDTARALDGGRGFGKNRMSLDLAGRYSADNWRLVAEIHGEYDAAYLAGRDTYDDPTLDVYEARILNGQQFVAASLGPVEVTLGRQIVTWGEGDALSPIDVVNPRDLREPGLADIDDLKLSVLATRVGWFEGAHRLEAMAVHEAYFGERPPPLGVFSPLRAFVLTDPAVQALLGQKTLDWNHDVDRFDPGGTQAFARWLYKGEGVDLGLYAAWSLDQQGVVRLPPLATLADERIELELHHARRWIAGHSGATAQGDWIIKWELSAVIGGLYNTGDPGAGLSLDALGEAEATLFTGMAGLTWSGIADTTIGLEAQAGLFTDAPPDLLFPADAPIIAARIIHQALQQKLRLLAAASVFGATAEYGWLLRAEATYALTDTTSVTGGYAHFGEGADGEIGPLYGLEKNDRLTLRLRWDFDLY